MGEKLRVYIELPLSTNTLWVLNPSMVSIMTRGSSWGCLIPFASCSDKTMSSFLTMFCHWVINRDVVHLPLNCLPQGLVWSSNNWSPSDHPYLSHDGFEIVLIFLYLIVSGFPLCPLMNLIVFLNKLLELSLLDLLLYLFLQISALVYVMSMVFMEVAVLLWISSLRGRAQWLRPFQGRVVFYLHEDLVHRHYQRGEI